MLLKIIFTCLIKLFLTTIIHAQADTAKSYFVIQLTAGENFEKGKPILAQKLKEHGRYMKKIFAEGKMVMAGPFTDDEGSLIILYVESEMAAKEIMDSDPAIKDKIFAGRLHRWHLFFKR